MNSLLRFSSLLFLSCVLFTSSAFAGAPQCQTDKDCTLEIGALGFDTTNSEPDPGRASVCIQINGRGHCVDVDIEAFKWANFECCRLFVGDESWCEANASFGDLCARENWDELVQSYNEEHADDGLGRCWTGDLC